MASYENFDGPVCHNKNLPVSNKTGKYICKQLGYDRLDKVGLIGGNTYWFAEYYPANIHRLNCEKRSCTSESLYGKCRDYETYVELSCSCKGNRMNVGTGCDKCPKGALITHTGECK
jgi:hypothetical protein